MFCQVCNFESFLPRSTEEPRCLKCNTLLSRRSSHVNTFGVALADQLQPRRLSGEVKTYEQLMLGEWESGCCEQSPNGTHHWKFGKCHYCQKAEGEFVHGSSTSATSTGSSWCPLGGKCSFKSARCCKCGRVRERSSERRSSQHSVSVSPRPSSRQSVQSRHKSVSPRPSLTSPPRSRQDSLSSRPSLMIERAKPEATCEERECQKCGYTCLTWLNDGASCLNCESLLKSSSSQENGDEGTRRALEGLPRRQTDCLNDVEVNATQSGFVSCQQSPNGCHVWHFGKCQYCQKPEGRRAHGSGSFSNPGGFFGICSMGGKCMCKFGRCVKCGHVEGSVPRRSSTFSDSEVPVGGSLRAIRKLQQTNSKFAPEEDDQSTSAGSDDEAPMITLPSNEFRIIA